MVKRALAVMCALGWITGLGAAQETEGIYFPPQSPATPNRAVSPADQLNRDVRVLRTTNKAQVNRYVVKAYALRNVNPFAVLRFMRRPIQAENGAIFTFIGPDGASGRVLIAVPEYQLTAMDALMATIDRPGLTSSSGTKRIYRPLKHRRANVSLIEALDDSDFINSFAVYLTGNNATIITDPTRNAVFFEDAPSGADYLDIALTDKLDAPTPQAIFNAKVYEIDMTNSARIGLDYIAWKNGPGAALFSFGAFSERGRNSIREGALVLTPLDTNGQNLIPSDGPLPRRAVRGDFQSQGYNFFWRYEFHSAFFDYLTVRGKAKVLNAARVAALNTRPARIAASDQLLYYAVQTSNPSGIRAIGDFANLFNADRDTAALEPGPGGRTVIGTTNQLIEGSLVPVETGLEINLTPTIYENGLDVSIDGALTSYNGFDDTGFPRINSRAFATTIRMGVGEEVVLGGFMRDEQIKASPKVPVLGSLPVIGYLFGGENTRRRQTEVVVALTTEQVVRYDAKGQGITDADRAILRQAEGTDPIQKPPFTWGFDMSLKDREKVHHLLTPPQN